MADRGKVLSKHDVVEQWVVLGHYGLLPNCRQLQIGRAHVSIDARVNAVGSVGRHHGGRGSVFSGSSVPSEPYAILVDDYRRDARYYHGYTVCHGISRGGVELPGPNAVCVDGVL